MEETIVGAVDKEGGGGGRHFCIQYAADHPETTGQTGRLPKSHGSQPNSGRRDEPVTCRKCGKEGHYARGCAAKGSKQQGNG